jgi:hypothetical protein
MPRTLAEFQAQLDEEDEDLPKGLIDGLEELRKSFRCALFILNSFVLCSLFKHTPFSKADALTLFQVKIKTGPLLLSLRRHTGNQQFGAHLEVAWPRAVHGGPAGSDRTG